ncbi:MAG: peptidoglycan editing factor PgeF [Nitrosomonas sp.]|nr:peptidoglycan editing factor PgeF [Nitrosomonas sp.]MDP1950387.1 peptidoglycan editing factor PgeF [Nitrosomonas sp.]
MHDWIIPDWPAPSNVKAIFTTRKGGVSSGPNDTYAALNLGDHVNDDPGNVAHNRTLLRPYLPEEPNWLKQVHGTLPVWMNDDVPAPEGDAALSRHYRRVCAVMVADCLPVFLCDTEGTVVGIVHAGWRGLAAGIIEQSVAAIRDSNGNKKLMAWLGPAIGPNHFEVGEAVREVFISYDSQSDLAFVRPHDNTSDKWLADLFLLARQRLAAIGVTEIYGGGVCTFSDPARFFSYRRDGETGRMAALIWLERSSPF